jgi:hypothetical protein
MGTDVLILEPDLLEGVWADQAGVAADDVVVEVIGDYQGEFGAGAGERALERAGVQHPE